VKFVLFENSKNRPIQISLPDSYQAKKKRQGVGKIANKSHLGKGFERAWEAVTEE
jgi:hypothetical protein